MDFYHYKFSKYPGFVAYPVQRWGFSPKRVLFDLSAQHSHSAQRFRDFGSPLPHSLTHSLTFLLTPFTLPYLTLMGVAQPTRGGSGSGGKGGGRKNNSRSRQYKKWANKLQSKKEVSE